MQTMYDIPHSLSDQYAELAERIGRQQDRTVKKKQAFLSYYQNNFGNVSRSCASAGITRRTFYNWLANDSDFKEATDLVLEYQKDDAENMLMILIRQKKFSAIKFFLERHHPDYAKEKKIVRCDCEVKMAVEDLLNKHGEGV